MNCSLESSIHTGVLSSERALVMFSLPHPKREPQYKASSLPKTTNTVEETDPLWP